MKTFIIILILLPAQIVFSQTAGKKNRPGDPFFNLITKMYFQETIAYDALSKKKALFDLDTSYSEAKVIVKKLGDSVFYLNIVNSLQQDELLFSGDSVWSVRHNDRKMHLIGSGIGKISENQLGEYFPVSLFNIDTLLYYQNPYWRTIKADESYDLVSIDITTKPEEISDFRVEVLIKKTDSLVYKLIQDVGFKGMTSRYYQELNFRNYTFPSAKDVVLPAYFSDYIKILPEMKTNEVAPEVPADRLKKDIFISAPELYDLEGNPFSLPKEGLIFVDLWYAGCFPCMKAAPVIEKLYHEYKDFIHFFSLNEIDSNKEKIIRFKENMGITMPLLLGGKEKLAVKVNNSNAYPAYFLMNANDGKVLWSFSGFSEDLEPIIREVIGKYLF